MTPAPSTRPTEATLSLDAVGAAILVCQHDGRPTGATPSAWALLARADVRRGEPLPRALWNEVQATPIGQSSQWRPPGKSEFCIGWTSYRYEGDRRMLLMREITRVQEELSRRLQQQRLEAIGRLAAGIAHDLRTPLGAIVFTASVLSTRWQDLPADEIHDNLTLVRDAAERMQRAIAGLLDYARLAPQRDVTSDLSDVVARVSALLRPLLRERQHHLELDQEDGCHRVRGNPLVIEQILANLVTNASEAADQPMCIRVRVGRAEADTMLALDVMDEGPGIPEDLRGVVFDPFFTTKEKGTGLGLTTSREAAASLGGDLVVLPSREGAHFRLTLRRARDSERALESEMPA